MAHYYQLSDTWGAMESSQPDVASVKEQKAAHKHVLSSLPWRHAEPLSPDSEDTTFYAKSQSTRNNSLSPTWPRSAKDFFKHIKNDTSKPSFGGRAKWKSFLIDR